MSDFFEQPDNQKLLRKIELKQNNGIDIKQDTIQLIAAAFDSMSDEELIQCEADCLSVEDLLQQYCPNISPIPRAAIRQLVHTLQQVLSDITNISAKSLGQYADLIAQICITIDQKNNESQQYNPEDPEILKICDNAIHDKPQDLKEWIERYNQRCNDYLNATDDVDGRLLAQVEYYYIHIYNFMA